MSIVIRFYPLNPCHPRSILWACPPASVGLFAASPRFSIAHNPQRVQRANPAEPFEGFRRTLRAFRYYPSRNFLLPPAVYPTKLFQRSWASFLPLLFSSPTFHHSSQFSLPPSPFRPSSLSHHFFSPFLSTSQNQFTQKLPIFAADLKIHSITICKTEKLPR
jgi:hypothetical protein